MSEQSDERTDHIRRRAHELSESEERGSDEENWHRAERELDESGGEPWAKTSSGDADSIVTES
jgi:hypothetical protein